MRAGKNKSKKAIFVKRHSFLCLKIDIEVVCMPIGVGTECNSALSSARSILCILISAPIDLGLNSKVVALLFKIEVTKFL